MINTVVNGLMYNITWLAIVMGHSNVFAPVIVAVHLLVHFAVMGRGRVEARLILAVAVFGFLLDQIMFRVGVFTLPEGALLAPLWLSCLWPVLATTLLHAFSGLQERYLLASFLGAIGGAASYTAGTRMTEVAFGSASSGPLLMALLWALLFPLLLAIARLTTQKEVAAHD